MVVPGKNQTLRPEPFTTVTGYDPEHSKKLLA